jgi:hypothetical protein
MANFKRRKITVANNASAINVARPVRSGQSQHSHSLVKSFQAFTYSDASRETVADALSHLLPTTTLDPATTGDAVEIQDSDDEAGPRGSPLTPVPSTSTLVVEADATAGAEVSPINETRSQQLSPNTNKRKRNVSPSTPVTPPPRRVRKKTTNATAPAPGLLVNLARNIEMSNTTIAAITEEDTTTNDSTQYQVDNALESTADDKAIAKEILNKALTIASTLLKRQRVLIHDYDAFDIKTYSPRGHVDGGTVALREFTDTLRNGLFEMEECIGELAEL